MAGLFQLATSLSFSSYQEEWPAAEVVHGERDTSLSYPYSTTSPYGDSSCEEENDWREN